MSREHTKYFLAFVKQINPQGATAWEILRDRFQEWLRKVDKYKGKLPDEEALKRKWLQLSNASNKTKRTGSGGPMSLEQAAIKLARELKQKSAIEEMDEEEDNEEGDDFGRRDDTQALFAMAPINQRLGDVHAVEPAAP